MNLLHEGRRSLKNFSDGGKAKATEQTNINSRKWIYESNDMSINDETCRAVMTT